MHCINTNDLPSVTQVVLRARDDAVRPHLLQELSGALPGPHTPVSPLQRELETGEPSHVLVIPLTNT